MRPAIAVLCVLALSAVFAVPAGAQSPVQHASGEGIFTDLQIVSTEFAGPNRIEVRRITGQVSGDLIGTWAQEVRGVVHPNGEVTFHGVWEFTGTVGDCGFGTVSGRLTGRGTAGPFPDFPITTARAWIIDQPSNTLSVVGQGVVTQQGPFIAYDLQYRCR